MGNSTLSAVVAGGGLAGLATALFLGRRGYQVTVAERDVRLPAGGADSVFSAWPRPGVPQARQPHNFLGRSVRILRQEAPDVYDTLIARGALPIPLDLGEGPGDAVLCARRPLVESIIRQAAQSEPTVAIRAGAAVTGLLTQPGEVPVVTGVVTGAGEAIRGDIVIDAAGRRSPLPALLNAYGTRPAVTISQDCGLMYISRYYRLRPSRDYPRLDTPIMAVLDWARAMAFPADNGTFALLATIAAQDPLRRTLCTDDGFARFHAAVPAIAPWLHAGQPLSRLRAMGRLENRYRRLADADGPIAGGLVLLGDSALHTNPTAARGTSLAFAQSPAPRRHPRQRRRSCLLHRRLRRMDRRQHRRLVPAPSSGRRLPRPPYAGRRGRQAQPATGADGTAPPGHLQRGQNQRPRRRRPAPHDPPGLTARKRHRQRNRPRPDRRPARRPPRTDRPSGRAQPRTDRRLYLATGPPVWPGRKPARRHRAVGEHDRHYVHTTAMYANPRELHRTGAFALVA
jgi:2-polyprenyl-6-methoxyphenol hydroxylase-like FAD-dependent oxidoreductase